MKYDAVRWNRLYFIRLLECVQRKGSHLFFSVWITLSMDGAVFSLGTSLEVHFCVSVLLLLLS